MNPKLQKLFDVAALNAAKLFLEGDDHEVLPMWHAVQGNGEHTLIVTPWNNDKEKEIAVAGLRQLFRERQVKRFVFIVEAWTAEVKPSEIVDVDKAYREYSGPRASEHPDRREILMVSAEDRDGSQIMGFYYILRPEHGPPTLSPLKVQPYDATAGRMVGLLT